MAVEPFDLVLLNGVPLFLKFEVVAYDGLIDCQGKHVLNEMEVEMIRNFEDTLKQWA
jgi:hypothetical protein